MSSNGKTSKHAKSDIEKTKQYKIKKSKKNKKSSNNEETKVMKNGKTYQKVKKPKQKKHKVLKRVILGFFLICLILVIIALGIVAGIFFSDKYQMSKDVLSIEKRNSTVLDADGNVIATLAGEENRKPISLDEMPTYLPKAFIAIEDKRFYEHGAVDWGRTLYAAVTYVFNGGKSSFGGSTITQQLIKNLYDDDDRSGLAGIERKIREMARAYNLEKVASKDEILETYLNYIYLGGYKDGIDVMGVEVASEYYFSKSAKDLTIAQAAFLAGINNTPNSYYPFDAETDNTEKIQTRTKTVLAEMKDQGYISEEEYNTAVAEVDAGLGFQKGNVSNAVNYSYHTSAAIEQVITDLMEQEEDLSYKAAKARIFSNGYTIYTTQKTEIQNTMETEYKKDTYVVNGREKKDGQLINTGHSQSAMVIIDHTTGQVVGTMGALGSDSDVSGMNRATQGKIQPGSSFKPIAVIAPALEEGIITAGTVYDDTKTTFGGNYSPKNSGSYRGLQTVRNAIAHSSNVINVKILAELGTSKSIEFLHNIGVENVGDSADLSLALGTPSVTPLEMAAAYATIANDGVYIEPTFYTKVEDSNGNTVVEATQESRRVMSEGNAYILKSILTAPVKSGTATNCTISGMDVAAKTGSTEEYRDRWLCGFTPYYTAATWFGFDNPERPRGGNISNSSNTASIIWITIMRNIHKGLPSASFQKTNNIVSATICLDSGKVATSSCSRTTSEVFVKGTVPGACEGHQKLTICTDTGKIANENCPNVEEKTYLVKPEKENTNLWSTPDGGKYNVPTETCTEHKEAEKVKVPNVLGKTEAQAKKALEDLGLKVQTKYDNDSSEDNGVVLAQSQKEGAEVERGATITITVNRKQTNTQSNTQTNNTTNKTNTQSNNVVDDGGTTGGDKTNTNDDNT